MKDAHHPVVAALIRRRKALGWTQADLAERVGINCKTLVTWETGRHDPKLGLVAAWAEALGYNLKLEHAKWTEGMRKFPEEDSGG